MGPKSFKRPIPVRRNRLWRLVEGVNRMPNRVMLRAVVFTDGDIKKPMIGEEFVFFEFQRDGYP